MLAQITFSLAPNYHVYISVTTEWSYYEMNGVLWLCTITNFYNTFSICFYFFKKAYPSGSDVKKT